MSLKDNDKVAVCSLCKMACCCQGIQRCYESFSQPSGVEIMTVATLRTLNVEHESYWVPLSPAECFDLENEAKLAEALKNHRAYKPTRIISHGELN